MILGRARGLAALGWTLTACASGAAVESPEVVPAPAMAVEISATSVLDGVYTVEQAAAGADQYARACSSCHAPDLRGNSNSPGLVGTGFLFLWEGKSLGELFTSIRTRMPTNAPNSLPAQAYADILAHLMAANQFPPGRRSLTPERALLDPIIITSNR